MLKELVVSVIIIITVLLFKLVRGQETCWTSTGEAKECIPLKECAPLKQISEKLVVFPDDIQLLRDSYCDVKSYGKRKVCCPIDSYNLQANPTSPIIEPIWIQRKPPLIFQTIPRAGPVSIETNHQETQTLAGNEECPPASGLPSEECCGRDAALNTRIIGGNETALEQYPWLALIEYHSDLVYPDRVEKLVRTSCAGTLISSRYVLTAAHCIKDSTGNPTNVRLGEYDTSSTRDCIESEGGGEECITAHIVPIESSIAHPGFDNSDNNRRHDIGLFRLKSDAPYTDFIRPICMPSQDATKYTVPTEFSVAGWGLNGLEKSDVKRHVMIPFVPMLQCRSFFLRNTATHKPIVLADEQVCAGGVKDESSCRGDSGGPLMHESGQVYQLVGVVSFGHKICGTEGIPTVFTNVFMYTDWIKSNMS